MMGRHEKQSKLWPEILGILAVACVLAAILLLVISTPAGHP